MNQKIIEIDFDFNKPEDARKFLFGLKSADGRSVTGFNTADGEWKDFSDLNDEDAMDRASELYVDWYKKGAVIWEPVIQQ